MICWSGVVVQFKSKRRKSEALSAVMTSESTSLTAAASPGRSFVPFTLSSPVTSCTHACRVVPIGCFTVSPSLSLPR